MATPRLLRMPHGAALLLLVVLVTLLAGPSAAAGAAGRTISLARPRAHQIVQRGDDGTGTFVLTGSVRGGGAVQARWNGGRWTTIDPDSRGGHFSGALSGLPAGQGTLSVRLEATPRRAGFPCTRRDRRRLRRSPARATPAAGRRSCRPGGARPSRRACSRTTAGGRPSRIPSTAPPASSTASAGTLRHGPAAASGRSSRHASCEELTSLWPSSQCRTPARASQTGSATRTGRTTRTRSTATCCAG